MWIRSGRKKCDSDGYVWTNDPVDVSEVIALTLTDLAYRQSQRMQELLGPMYETKKEKTAAPFHSDAAAG